MALTPAWTYESEEGIGIALPAYAQKTLYKNTILFVSKGRIYAAGAVTGDLPFALSQHATPTYRDEIRALAAPFGVPMVSSGILELSKEMLVWTSTILEKFSGYETDSFWKGLTIPMLEGKHTGVIDYVVVRTASLQENAVAEISFLVNQSEGESVAGLITGAGKRRHVFQMHKNCEDLRPFIDFSLGSSEVPCPIKSIFLIGQLK